MPTGPRTVDRLSRRHLARFWQDVTLPVRGPGWAEGPGDTYTHPLPIIRVPITLSAERRPCGLQGRVVVPRGDGGDAGAGEALRVHERRREPVLLALLSALACCWCRPVPAGHSLHQTTPIAPRPLCAPTLLSPAHVALEPKLAVLACHQAWRESLE